MSQGQGTRRRTKKTEIKGDFKCKFPGCEKEYLSYPALYTHIKQKHGSDHLKGMERPKTQGSRGRPRREEVTTNQVQEEAPFYLKIQIDSLQTIDNFLLELVSNKYYSSSVIQQEASNISKQQVIDSIHQVFQFIENTFQSNTKQEECFLATLIHTLNNKNDNSFEIENNLIKTTCDEAICIFLKQLSHTINLEFLQNIAYYLLCFRNYINKNNPQNSTQPKEFGQNINNFMQNKTQYFYQLDLEKFYEDLKNKNKIYLDYNKSEDLQQKIGLYFCTWLFNSRFANKEVKLVQDELNVFN